MNLHHTEPSYERFLQLIWPKAVLGMQRTYERRPFRTVDGVTSKSNRAWMLTHPTLDRLWTMSGPAHYRRELAIRRAMRARKAVSA